MVNQPVANQPVANQPVANQPVAKGLLLAGPMKKPASRSIWYKMARTLRANRAGALGLVVLICVFGVAIFAPLITPHDPLLQDLKLRLLPPAWMVDGNVAYFLGTDHLGRDILSRVIYGARISLLVGFSSVILSLVFGTLMGLWAGFYGGWVDDVISRLMDIQLAIPYMLLAVALVMVLGSSLPNLIMVLVLYGWTVYARLVRGQVLSVREREYVLAARTIGARSPRMILRHILPNVINPILVIATLEVANMIIFEASLSFLGLGVRPPTPSWGGMLADGRDYIAAGTWWPATFPGLAISLTVLSVNLVGDWLRDVLDPRMRT